jgi:hypothetical protein
MNHRILLGVHSRYGLHTRAVTAFRDTLIRRLQPFRCLHDWESSDGSPGDLVRPAALAEPDVESYSIRLPA